MAAKGVHFLDASGPEAMRIYAIGDVHGRLDLLTAMHEKIAAELERDGVNDWRIIHIGDYVDRGPDACGVIGHLIAQTAHPNMIALCGNHDLGLLDFLNNPEPSCLFTRHGGDATARSYGVEPDFSDAAAAQETAAALHKAVAREHQAFIADLPASVSFGDFFFCHAGIRPEVPLDEQALGDLIWIREPFLDYAGLHPKVIVHGHTPRSKPEAMANRVNVDTYAVGSGVLTALVIDGAEKRFLTATA